MSGLDQFKSTYITECYELLEEMEEKLLGLDGQTADKEVLNAIFRFAHSIKGGGGAFNIGQDEQSCVVYGMPKAAYLAGAVDVQLPLHKMVQTMMEYMH